MVFLIQNTQNRDTAAIQIKLDELIRGAHNALLDLEELEDEALDQFRKKYEALRRPLGETWILERKTQITRYLSNALTPNPSLNHRTPNGGQSWPGLGYAVHSPSPGQAIPP